MKGRARVDTRIRLAEGHWALGEHAEALRCVERAAEEDPADRGLVALIARMQSAVASGDAPAALLGPLREIGRRVTREAAEGAPGPVWDEATDELPPLPTSTLAELFAEQGLTDKAVRVARGVLERNPGDERARRLLARLARGADSKERVIATLERWLANLQRRRAQGGAER